MVEFETNIDRPMVGEQSLIGIISWDAKITEQEAKSGSKLPIEKVNIAPDQTSIIFGVDRASFEEIKESIIGINSVSNNIMKEDKTMITAFNSIIENQPEFFSEENRYVEARTVMSIRSAGIVEEDVLEVTEILDITTYRGEIIATTNTIWFTNHVEDIVSELKLEDNNVIFTGTLFDIENELFTT